MSGFITRGRGMAAALLAAVLLVGPAAGPSYGQDASTDGCPRGAADGPNACSGRPLLAPPGMLQLRSGEIVLLKGQVGHDYNNAIVESIGSREASLEVDGEMPPGIELSRDGVLSGRAETAGVYRFTVTLIDRGSNPPRLSRAYVLEVLPATTARPPVPHSPAKARPVVVAKKDAPPPPPPPPPPPVADADVIPGAMVIYELTPANLAGLIGAAKPAPKGKVSVVQSTALQKFIADPTKGLSSAVGGKLPAVPQDVQIFTGGVAQKMPTGGKVNGPVAAGGDAPELELPDDFRDRAAQVMNTPYPSRDLFTAALMFRTGISAEKAGAIADYVRGRYNYGGAKAPAWAPEPHCFCSPFLEGPDDKLVYGFYPFWRSNGALPFLFRRFNRIGVIGAQLQPNGSWTFQDRDRPKAGQVFQNTGPWTYPSLASGGEPWCPDYDWWDRVQQRIGFTATPSKTPTWCAGLSAFALAAQAHGAHLDLVFQGMDWSQLADLPQEVLVSRYESAAREAMSMLDVRLNGRGFRALLAAGWQEPQFVFDGMTVMLDPPPHDAGAKTWTAYRVFYDGYLREVVRGMQQRKRPFALNIVARDDMGDHDVLPSAGSKAADAALRSAKPGAPPLNAVPISSTAAAEEIPNETYTEQAQVWREFLAIKQLAEPAAEHKDLPYGKSQLYVGETRISVRLMTPLKEPTTFAKKAIRAKLDLIDDIRGVDRAELANSTIPILYLPEDSVMKGKPSTRELTRGEADQLADDLVYASKNFGGVAFWSMPVRGVPAGNLVYEKLQENFFAHRAALVGAPWTICSLPLRLFMQLLVLVLIVGGIYFVFWGSASSRRFYYLAGLGVTAGVGLVTFLILLQLDPALEAMRIGNLPLIVTVVALLATALWTWKKPRVPRP